VLKLTAALQEAVAAKSKTKRKGVRLDGELITSEDAIAKRREQQKERTQRHRKRQRRPRSSRQSSWRERWQGLNGI
jgi:hypothetical protein